MRYGFWFLFCAFVCKGDHVWGALGVGVAISTHGRLPWGLGLRLPLGILWMVVLTTFYFWVFRSVSYGTNREVLFWGIAFAFPAAAILVLRGIAAWLKTFRKSDTDPTS